MPIKGYKQTIEHKKRIGLSNKGRIRLDIAGENNPMKNPEIAKKVSISSLGKPRPWNLGHKHGFIKGTPSWNRGKKFPERSGENHPRWSGGKIAKLERRSLKFIKEQEKLAGRPKPLRCELCGRGGRICYDHDHKTNTFRGWICLKCNCVLGFIDDNPNILEKMIEYLSVKSY